MMPSSTRVSAICILWCTPWSAGAWTLFSKHRPLALTARPCHHLHWSSSTMSFDHPSHSGLEWCRLSFNFLGYFKFEIFRTLYPLQHVRSPSLYRSLSPIPIAQSPSNKQSSSNKPPSSKQSSSISQSPSKLSKPIAYHTSAVLPASCGQPVSDQIQPV